MRSIPESRMRSMHAPDQPGTIPGPTLDVFAAVVSVSFGHVPMDGALEPVPDIWAYFPAMRELVLSGDSVLSDCVVSGGPWSRLEWLRLQTSAPALLHAFEHAPAAMAQVPHVEIRWPLPGLEEALALHVAGSLQIALQIAPDADGGVRIHLGDAAWRRSRGILTSLSDWLDHDEPPIFSSLKIVDRLISLTLPDVLWAAVTRSRSRLPNLTELRLVVDHESGVAFTKLRHVGKLICPSLKRLVLRVDEGEYYVTLSQVSAFASDGSRSWDEPLELQFEGVTLVGYGRRIPDDETFTYSWKPKEHWTYPDMDWE